MKKRLLLATALTALSFSAFAADLPKRAAPPAATPIFAGIDAFVSVGAGYNWGQLEHSARRPRRTALS